MTITITTTTICSATAAAAAAAAAGSDGTSIPGLCLRLWPTGYWRVPRPLYASEPPTAVEQSRTDRGGGAPGGITWNARRVRANSWPRPPLRATCTAARRVAIAIYPPIGYRSITEFCMFYSYLNILTNFVHTFVQTQLDNRPSNCTQYIRKSRTTIIIMNVFIALYRYVICIY